MNNDAFDNVQEPLHAGQVYCPPEHTTSLNLGDDEPNMDIFYNPYTHTDGALQVGDTFRTKEDCLRVIKKWHMHISADFTVDRTNARRYIILCRQKPTCMFRLTTSYKKRYDCWEICSIHPPHSCITTGATQDHRKLGSDLICQRILPLISKDLSLEVSTIISHIVTRFNYTPSYRKAWIARTKAVKRVYDNWEDSYKEILKYLLGLKYYASGTVVILETLLTFTPDRHCAGGNSIFHQIVWAYEPCIIGFAFWKPIIQIDGTWLDGKYKGTLLMVVAQDGNGNVFPIAFGLVEGETTAAWIFF